MGGAFTSSFSRWLPKSSRRHPMFGNVAGRLCVAGALVAAVGCDTTPAGLGYASPTDTTQRVAQVSVFTLGQRVRVGRSEQLGSAVLSDHNKIMTGQRLVWTSSDTTIATVNADGYVHGEKIGTVAISATAGGKAGALFLRIFPGACSELSGKMGINESSSGLAEFRKSCIMTGGVDVSSEAKGWLF